MTDEGFRGQLQRKNAVAFFEASLEKLDLKEVDSLGKEVAAPVEKYNLKDVNLDAVVIPEQQLAYKFVLDDDILATLKYQSLKGFLKTQKRFTYKQILA